MTFYDRVCVNEALDILLDRENGEDKKEPEDEDERFDREAERAASRSFDTWAEEGDDAEED